MMLKEKLSLFLMEVKEMIKKDEILDLKVCEGLESNTSWIPGAPCTLVAWWFIAMLIHSTLTVFFSPFYSKKVVGPLVGWSWSSFEVNLLFLFCERLSMLKGYTGSSRGGSERSRQTTFPGKDSNLMGAGMTPTRRGGKATEGMTSNFTEFHCGGGHQISTDPGG